MSTKLAPSSIVDQVTRSTNGHAGGTPVPAVAAYDFTPAFPAGHLVADYITYAAERTDACLEYHEAGALILLAMATPQLTAQLAPYPRGLSTNLYLAIIGESTVSRKSTAKALVQSIQECVDSGSRLADEASPEGFVEQLAGRNGRSSLWGIDEFSETLHKLRHAKYMAGLKGLLLSVYDGSPYRLQRHSKRRGKGAKAVKEADADVIEEPYLSVLATTTPSLFERLEPSDVHSGLLPRFAIVMPTARPPRRPFYATSGAAHASQAALVARLHRVLAWCTVGAQRAVVFAPGALEAIDGYAEAMERRSLTLDEVAKAMLQRLVPMALKVAMLAAAGRPDTPLLDGLEVSVGDAEASLMVIQRWEAYALAFAERVGESRFERDLRRCARVIEREGVVLRRIIARTVHLDKKMLDLVEATMTDRGMVRVRVDRVGPATSGPPTTWWEWVK
jgi:hypothetical protein